MDIKMDIKKVTQYYRQPTIAQFIEFTNTLTVDEYRQIDTERELFKTALYEYHKSIGVKMRFDNNTTPPEMFIFLKQAIDGGYITTHDILTRRESFYSKLGATLKQTQTLNIFIALLKDTYGEVDYGYVQQYFDEISQSEDYYENKRRYIRGTLAHYTSQLLVTVTYWEDDSVMVEPLIDMTVDDLFRPDTKRNEIRLDELFELKNYYDKNKDLKKLGVTHNLLTQPAIMEILKSEDFLSMYE